MCTCNIHCNMNYFALFILGKAKSHYSHPPLESTMINLVWFYRDQMHNDHVTHLACLNCSPDVLPYMNSVDPSLPQLFVFWSFFILVLRSDTTVNCIQNILTVNQVLNLNWGRCFPKLVSNDNLYQILNMVTFKAGSFKPK